MGRIYDEMQDHLRQRNLTLYEAKKKDYDMTKLRSDDLRFKLDDIKKDYRDLLNKRKAEKGSAYGCDIPTFDLTGDDDDLDVKEEEGLEHDGTRTVIDSSIK